MNKIKILLKNNKYIYNVYTIIFSLIFKIWGIFIKTDNKLILMNSFGGLKYDDSPKVIYEYMLKNPRYDSYKVYWAFGNLNITDKVENKVKVGTLKYFYLALKAKYWITNSAIEKGLKFKKKDTIYINTWHGTALKKMGVDISKNNYRFNTSKIDIMYAQSEYDIDTFSRVFELPKENFVLAGLPRNDELTGINNEEIQQIKNKLKIPNGKKIILYAPTFREYNRDKNGCIISPPLNLKYWKESLSDEYILIFRAHYEINTVLGIENDGFVYNLSDYINLNELLKISDILVTDYSSIMFDYAILERPIFLYGYDYEEYNLKRGLYKEVIENLPNEYIKKEKELIENIKSCDFENEKNKTKMFKEKFITVSGNAQKYIDEIIGE